MLGGPGGTLASGLRHPYLWIGSDGSRHALGAGTSGDTGYVMAEMRQCAKTSWHALSEVLQKALATRRRRRMRCPIERQWGRKAEKLLCADGGLHAVC